MMSCLVHCLGMGSGARKKMLVRHHDVLLIVLEWAVGVGGMMTFVVGCRER